MLLLLLLPTTPTWTVDALFSNQAMTPNHQHHHFHRLRRWHHSRAIISTPSTSSDADAMMSNHRIRSSRSSSSRVTMILHGISEWREHYSSISTTTNQSTIISSSSTTPSYPQNINITTTATQSSSLSKSSSSSSPLPLLLLPFPPTQILLPGQSTTFQFKHGKYMDLIDDSITNYYGTLGFSILGDDGLLSTVVLCEIIEDTLDVKMGYRGFSSMEVGIRAVGRARRVVVEGGGLVMGSSSEGSSSSSTGIVSTSGNEMGESSYYYLYGRKKTAIEDIHLGLCEEFRDDDDILTMKEDVDAALECVSNIKSLLMSTSSSTAQKQQQQQQQSSSVADGKLLQRLMLFDKAYEAMVLHLEEASSSCGNASSEHRNIQLEAYSWAAFAACDDYLARSSSPTIVVRALETKDVLERLRLGLAMLLDCQLSPRSNNDDNNFARVTTRHADNNAVVGDNDANSFQ